MSKHFSPVVLRAVRHLRFVRIRLPGEEFTVPNRRWAEVFVNRGLAELAGDQPIPSAAPRAKTQAQPRRKRSETDRTPRKRNAEIGLLLTA